MRVPEVLSSIITRVPSHTWVPHRLAVQGELGSFVPRYRWAPACLGTEVRTAQGQRRNLCVTRAGRGSDCLRDTCGVQAAASVSQHPGVRQAPRIPCACIELGGPSGQQQAGGARGPSRVQTVCPPELHWLSDRGHHSRAAGAEGHRAEAWRGSVVLVAASSTAWPGGQVALCVSPVRLERPPVS